METEINEALENEIVKGIVKQLRQAFGSEFRVYAENVKQGFTEPCFSIEHLLTLDELKTAAWHLRRHSFNVHYFPKDDLEPNDKIHRPNDKIHRPNYEMHNVARQLFLELEYILVLDNLVKASKMTYEIQEGHLHFFVDYNVFVKKQRDEDELMETLIHKKVEE